MPQPHEILGVPRDAEPDLIRRAYRALARRYHPDASGSSDTGARFAEITEAYERLVKSPPRARGTARAQSAPSEVWEEDEDPVGVYDAFYNASAPSRDARPAPYTRRAGGLDLEIELPLTPVELAAGGEFDVPSPAGPVAVRIGAGSSPGAEIRVPGSGALGRDRTRGDLVVVLSRIDPSGGERFPG